MAHNREEQEGKSILELWHEHFGNGSPESNPVAVRDAVNGVANVSSNGINTRYNAQTNYSESNKNSEFDKYLGSVDINGDGITDTFSAARGRTRDDFNAVNALYTVANIISEINNFQAQTSRAYLDTGSVVTKLGD